MVRAAGFFRVGRIVALGLILFIAACWIFFYIQSWYQKRRAEALIKELKTFPFATATFEQVRDLTLRYGGSPLPPPRLPPDLPRPKPPAPPGVTSKTEIPFGRSQHTCTTQDCTFLIWVGSGLTRFRLLGKTAEFLYGAAHLVGIRSWGAGVLFEVHAGRLKRSSFSVGEFREGKCVTSNDLILWSYEVETRDYAPGQPYSVGFTHVTGQPSYNFGTFFVPMAGPPPQGLFDVNLDCLTTPFRDCRDMSELAPAAWASFQAKVTSPPNFQCY